MAAKSEMSDYEACIKLLRCDLSSFIQKSFHTVDPGARYHHNWHIDAMAEYLRACERREIKRLIINIPPRSLKSVCVNVAWPAWLLGQNPANKILTASYSQQLSIKHSLDTRLILQSQWYNHTFPGTIIAPDQNEKSKFMTTRRGFRFATSVGGTATGEGGNYLIVDDPTNPLQAASDVERQNANDWFSQTFSSRLNIPDQDVIVLVMQRLHEEDLTGYLLAKNSGWEHLCLPAKTKRTITISMGDFKRTFKEDELLHPARLSQAVLDEKKKEMGTYAYEGQYMQNPVPDGGGILQAKWWKLWPHKKLPEFGYIIQTYDTAFKTEEENDYTARTTWGVFLHPSEDGVERYCVLLLERMNKRLSFPELREEAYRSYLEYEPDEVLVEDKASGQSLIQELRRKGIPVKAAKVKGDKRSRAHAVSSILERGAVFYVDKEWVKDVILQCSSFPKGAHDDIVDTVVHTLERLRRKFWLQLPDDEKDEEDDNIRPDKRFYG